MERLYADKLMLPVLEENPFWQQIIKGVIIISAVAFDMARSRTRR